MIKLEGESLSGLRVPTLSLKEMKRISLLYSILNICQVRE
jgi:hypothetical protein